MRKWFSRLRRVVPQPWQPWAIIVSIFIALGVYYSVTTPLWEAPDEPAHFGNVWYIATHKQLPVPGTFYTWHQSPLYHIIAAAFISGVEMSTPQEWIRPNPRSPAITNSGDVNIALHSLQELAPYRDIALAAHIARWVNVVFGAITVSVTYILGRRIFPARPWIAIGAAGLVAFNPQFIFMNSVVQNDALLSAAFASALLPALSIVQGDYRVRQFLGLGALTGVAILAKQSGIVLIGMAGAVILWAAWQTRGWKNLLVWSGWTGLALLATAGPMYLRNTIKYGDPFAYQVYKTLHPPVEPLNLETLTLAQTNQFFRLMSASYWGKFGWLTVDLPDPIYTVLWWIIPLTLAGLLCWLWRGRQEGGQPNGGLVVILLLLLSMAAVWTFTLRYVSIFGAFGVQGRYLFPMISAQALLISLGFGSLFLGRWSPVPIAVLLTGLLGMAVMVPSRVISPAFEYLGTPPQALTTVEFQRDDTFGGVIKVAGYDLAVEQETGQAELSIYWQVLDTPQQDYTIFVHLLDAAGNRYAQYDHRPLDGKFPTQAWRAGDVFHRDYTFTLPETCLNIDCYFVTGFYLSETGERLPVTAGWAENNAVILDEFLSAYR